MAERIVVGMSGGVDSSVAAALLVERGFDVVGVTLRVWPWREPKDGTAKFGSCCSPETVGDARQVARQLGIPYYLLNSEREFDRTVIENFAQEYAAGRTPVPCLICNQKVKFGSLLSRARAWDARAVATGHYARITWHQESKRYWPWRGRDPGKDQSYVLAVLTSEQISHAMFPLGDTPKAQVRVEATRRGAVDFLEKPPQRERILVSIRNALSRDSLRAENERLRHRLEEESVLVGKSAPMQRLRAEGIQIARRTVAKYREELRIPSSSQRKQSF